MMAGIFARKFPWFKNLDVIAAYLALLALSLPIPILHWKRINGLIETIRPYFRAGDGKLTPMLMPADALMLRWLGEVAFWIPVVALVMFALSFRVEAFGRFKTICGLAIMECAFTTLYALTALMVLIGRN